MHLRAANRFLGDSAVPEAIRAALGKDHLGPFLLGNVAPDARVSGGMARANTHFFDYGAAKISPPAGIAMLSAYPQLRDSQDNQQAFVAGYLAHLAMDVVWAEAMLHPHFYMRDWANQKIRYIMLHVLLCDLDGRDFQHWPSDYGAALADAEPESWLPFLPDSDLRAWRDIIAGQICDACGSQTLSILGHRVSIGETGLREILENPARMQHDLWQHIPPSVVDEVETTMYITMRDELIRYMEGTLIP